VSVRRSLSEGGKLGHDGEVRRGRELINPSLLADVRFGAHYGLQSDFARGPKSARNVIAGPRGWASNGAAQRHTNVPSRISVGRLQIGLPCVDQYLKHLICFGAPEVARVEPHGIEPLRILPLPERIRVREDVAAI
jgi:hypothetical protein